LVEDNMADTIVIGGTTGEFFTMNFEERVKFFQVIKEAVGNKINLIAGTGCVSTIETTALSKKVEDLGYELIMVASPYYTRPTQDELYNHFKKVAESINIQMTLYNIPIFTGVNINPQTVAKLSEIDNIVAIKEEAELNPKQITEFINVTSEDFVIYCGDDSMILEAFAQGGSKRIGGIISGASHIIGEQLRNMIEIFLQGKVQEAAEIQQRFLPLFKSWGQNGRFNPCSLLKESMKMIGYRAGIPRLPLTPGTEEEIAEVRRVMKKLGII
ncbi:MAG TPA: 4-hydroxy-tetrahydrodipicolinate synthase, partial [Candidatus Atribacteria bacterium]|nr:4-hydroxy-tetrahydrodipicolinate synthase [Candidatus Atribacteria bacterium]